MTFQSSPPQVFFGGDSAFGPKNIITAVAQGHEAAISIDAFCRGEDPRRAPAADDQSREPEDGHPRVVLRQRHRRSIAGFKVPHVENAVALKNIHTEVELGFDPVQAFAEAQRCLNCDVETVFSTPACIECDACVDICPIDCISFVANAPEDELRPFAERAARSMLTQAIYVSDAGQDRARHGEGRGPLPALRPLRRTLPDRRLGHAEFTIDVAQAEHACRSMP